MNRRWTLFFCEKIAEAIVAEWQRVMPGASHHGAQKAFARKTKEVLGEDGGYSESYISQIVNKQVSGLPVDTVIELCEVLGLNFARLYCEQRAKEALWRASPVPLTYAETREWSQRARAQSRAICADHAQIRARLGFTNPDGNTALVAG